jgi:hypothetical protein
VGDVAMLPFGESALKGPKWIQQTAQLYNRVGDAKELLERADSAKDVLYGRYSNMALQPLRLRNIVPYCATCFQGVPCGRLMLYMPLGSRIFSFRILTSS